MHLQVYFGLIELACWAVFVGYWAYSARMAKPTVGNRLGAAGIWMRIAIVIAAIALVKMYPQIKPTSPFAVSLWQGSLGCTLSVIGIAIAVWARYYLGRNWGMPMSVKEHAELVTSGPYHWVRNPIYTGVMLATLGAAFVAGPLWLIVFACVSAYFIFSLLEEEKEMQKNFPNEYPQYKARTWRLIPYIF